MKTLWTYEQPFTRSGSVTVEPDEALFIRAHMHPLGYQGDVFSGSVSQGFAKIAKPPIFPKELETQAPLPSGCAF